MQQVCSRCAAQKFLLELHSQGVLRHATCTSNEGPTGTDRVSSFSLLGPFGVAIARLHGLTSRLLRSIPSPYATASTQSRHSGLMYEQQWHAVHPVAGFSDRCSLEDRACVRRLRPLSRVALRMGGAPVCSQSQPGKEAVLVCAAVIRKVQAGSHSSAWVTRAAQLAGTFAHFVFQMFSGTSYMQLLVHCCLPVQVMWQGGGKQALQVRRSGAC